ncbi:cytochrome b [Thiomicrorhabdus sp. 6S3-12]|uniref:cytochrome b n=1 Tax=Thiomicrorhabdus sp. 6S3-12 TaxID=2819681 RepID=UPI001AAD7F59|nr:cytochrome b [Thiomicrorhabdus sp. 6S3-12]MBO1923078.1 cytochrome b [Thiomicrorhabdus sp. 6S3-12]
MDTKQQLSRQTLFLHWLVAFGMIAMLASGIYMDEAEVFALYPWHKSFGVLLLAFILWRIYWRVKNGWLEPVREYKPLEITLSKVVHWVLIIGTVLMPISGMMMSGLGGHGIPFFGLELMARNPDPQNPQEVIAVNATLAGLGKTLHGLGGNLIILAVVLHIAGALKHHFIDKDVTLKRMTGQRLSDND